MLADGGVLPRGLGGTLGFAAASGWFLTLRRGAGREARGGQKEGESDPQKRFGGGREFARGAFETAREERFHKMKRKIRAWGDFRFFKEFNFPHRGH